MIPKETGKSAENEICTDCGVILNPDEKYYFEERCTVCEMAFNDRITAWQNGAEDKELDRMYGAPPRTIN